MRKLCRLLVSFLCFFLVSCAGIIKPEQYQPTGEYSAMTLVSEGIRDYNFIPLLNHRKVMVSVYDKAACPDGLRSKNPKKGYLYTATLTKKNWQFDVKLPADEELYVLIEEETQGYGSVMTCYNYFKFKSDGSSKYELDINVRSALKDCNFGYAEKQGLFRLYNVQDDEKNIERSLRYADWKTEWWASDVLSEKFCREITDPEEQAVGQGDSGNTSS